MNEKKVCHYCCAVSSYLPCSAKQKKQIMQRLRQRAEEHYAQYPDDMTTIEDLFGSPQSVAAAYVEDMNTTELLVALRIRRRVSLVLLSGIILALTIWLTACIISLRDFRQAVNGWNETMVTETKSWEVNN